LLHRCHAPPFDSTRQRKKDADELALAAGLPCANKRANHDPTSPAALVKVEDLLLQFDGVGRTTLPENTD